MKNKIILFLLTSCSIYFCGERNTTKDAKHGVSTKPPKEKTIEQKEAEANKEFAKFWVQFKKAVLTKDKDKVLGFVNFPFKDNFNYIHSPEHSLTCNTSDEFMKKYDLIFDSLTIKAIKIDNYRIYSDDDWPPLEGIDGYLLMTEHLNLSNNLVFEKINNQYSITAIAYHAGLDEEMSEEDAVILENMPEATGFNSSTVVLPNGKTLDQFSQEIDSLYNKRLKETQ